MHGNLQNTTSWEPLEPLAPFGRRLSIYALDIQLFNDAARTLASLKQTNHDMVSFLVEAQIEVEELGTFLDDDCLEGIRKKLDRLYMALILRTLNLDFNHSRGQLLTSHEVPIMDNLITKLLSVTTK